MSAATKRLRAEICKRAEGFCEKCGTWVGLNGEHAHLDHFHGRAKAVESLETCWLLCIADDERKTQNKPDAAFWLTAFIKHCGKYGYPTERAEARLQTLQAKGLVAA